VDETCLISRCITLVRAIKAGDIFNAPLSLIKRTPFAMKSY
jgi:hypothetical protein